MASYDTAATYDSGLRYDAAPAITPPKKMSKVKLDLRRKSDGELNNFAKEHITKITGNANFTTPDPIEADFQTMSDDFDAALAEAMAAQLTAKEKTATKDAKRSVLETGLTNRGKYVDLKSGGDKAKILSAGFDVAGDRTPPGVPAMVVNLSVTSSEGEGGLDLHWEPVYGAKSYQVQVCIDPITAAGWVEKAAPTKSMVSISGLTSGTKVWIRVRAIGAGGVGAWSDPATKVVP